MLYYTILDAIYVILFTDINDVPLPDFSQMTPDDSFQWLNSICQELVRNYFFEDAEDIVKKLEMFLKILSMRKITGPRQ